jgi:hypothetical protein
MASPSSIANFRAELTAIAVLLASATRATPRTPSLPRSLSSPTSERGRRAPPWPFTSIPPSLVARVLWVVFSRAEWSHGCVWTHWCSHCPSPPAHRHHHSTSHRRHLLPWLAGLRPPRVELGPPIGAAYHCAAAAASPCHRRPLRRLARLPPLLSAHLKETWDLATNSRKREGLSTKSLTHMNSAK